MNPTVQTAPTVEPVTTAEAKAQCRVDFSTDDTIIDSIITAARHKAEAFLSRAIINTTFDYYLDRFPCDDHIPLPGGRLQSITSLKYTDADGTETTWDSANYIAVASHEPGRLHLAYATQWPSVTLKAAEGIVVRYVAGYGSSASSVPSDIKQAILLIIGHLYAHRGDSSDEMPEAAMNLLWPHRILSV